MPLRSAVRTAILPILTTLAACGQGVLDDKPERQAHAQGGENLSENYGLLPAVHIKDDLFVDDKDQPQPIHGFSWFGFNTGTGAPDGLWGNDPIGNDFERAVRRQKLLGFNAVRLPFSFSEFPKEPRKFSIGCQDVSDEDVAKATLMPNTNPAMTAAEAPKLAWPAKREAGQCNGYLPTQTTRERYIWTVLFYVRNNFYVLVDNHYREDQTAETDEKAWVQGWADLAHDLLVAHPETQGRVFFDLLNEPGQYGQAWEKNTKAGVHHLYLAAMDAIWAVSDKAIFALEGTGQDALGANWGDGFCTDAGKIQQLGLSDPRPFFTELAGKPYKGAVSLAPHVYGPDVTHQTANFSGQGLTDRLDASFGTLTKDGFAGPAGPLKFPIAIGEFGSKFTGQGDVEFMRDFAKYLKDGGEHHNAINHWFYWDWNADSGDTGGLVTDNWRDIEWVKVSYLKDSLGLRPWWDSSPPAAAPTAPATSTSGQTAQVVSAPPQQTSTNASTGASGAPQPGTTSSSISGGQELPNSAGVESAKPATTSATPIPTAASANAQTPPPSSATNPAGATPAQPPSTTAGKPESEKPSSGPSTAPSATPQASQSSLSPSQKPTVSLGPPSATPAGSSHSAQTSGGGPQAPEGDNKTLSARIGWDGHWTKDGFDYFTVNIHLSAKNQRIGTPYKVTFKGPRFDMVQEAWNLDNIKISEGTVEGTVNAPWGTLLPNTSAETVIGMIYRVKQGDGKIHEVLVNDQPATIS